MSGPLYTIDGLPEQAIAYEFEYEGLTHTGTVVSITVPETAMGYLLLVDELPAYTDEGAVALAKLLE